ncbi:MAG: hypothetical protein MUF10_11360 [Thermoanaerobaculaceae bacterium]|nr:hypothetical protein [Thermoanaerobaculaceae bacterium]
MRQPREGEDELAIRHGRKVTPDTQIPSDLKDGAAVTVEYALVAKVVTTRPEPPRSTKPTRPRAD